MRIAFLVLAACVPARADAHLLETGLGPVYDGIAHFVLSPEDLLPVLAVAVLAGLRGRDHARRAVLVLPLAWLLAGAVAAASGAAMPGALAWLPLIVVGGLVAADFALSARVTAALAALAGAFLGFANGTAMAQAGTGLRGVLGVACAVLVVSVLVAAAATAWQRGWLRIAWRVAGSWIAAGGVLLLGWSLR